MKPNLLTTHLTIYQEKTCGKLSQKTKRLKIEFVNEEV